MGSSPATSSKRRLVDGKKSTQKDDLDKRRTPTGINVRFDSRRLLSPTLMVVPLPPSYFASRTPITEEASGERMVAVLFLQFNASKGPASLGAAVRDVLRHGSALNRNSARRSSGNVKIPYAFPLTETQKVRVQLEEKEQRFKNLVVLAIILVAASSVGRYCAAAEASEDARLYVGAVTRAMHKRQWDLACLEDTRKGKRGRNVEVGGRKKRVKLSSSVTSDTEDEDEDLLNDEPQEDSGDSGEEEEIPHLVELGIKNEQIENDVASCVESARAVQSALYSCQGWLEDQYPTRGALRSAEDVRDVDSLHEDNASEASNPFLESPKPKRKNPSSPAHEGEDSEPCAEDLTLLSSQFFMAAQAALFTPPYASGDAEIRPTAAPIKAVLHDERERMKDNLPVDHARVKHDLEKALREAQKAQRLWDKRKNDAASKAAFAVGRAAKGIMLGLQGDDEDEFKGVDNGDSDSEEEEDVGFKASLIVTLAMVQVTLVTCIVSEKKLHDVFDYSRDLPSSLSIQRSGKTPREAAQEQKARRMESAVKERENAEKRKNIRAGLAKVACQMSRSCWDGLVPENLLQDGRWESEADFWGDMTGLEDQSDERVAADDEGEKKFDKLELTTLAAIKHLGLATFRLFFDLYSGADEWESSNPVPKFADHAMHLAGGGDEVEPLDPQRLGNLGEQEKISSWLKSMISSPLPSASGGEKDAEQPAGSAVDGTFVAVAEDNDADKENRKEVSAESVKDRKPAKKPKLSKNDKLASLWKSKKKTTKAQKEARTKALEMARQANIQRKEDEERKCVEAERRRAAALARRTEGRMEGKKKGNTGRKGKGRSKAQKEALEKAKEAARAKRVREAAGRA
ncbi:hypothetical protein NMY22_g15738 [Coprinellus aureogranulatus]|nr:hypothetical protein NMY22_g15738 [Coprinellus aureogranulatus]